MKLSEIRKEAREILNGKWGKSAIITLAFISISFAIGLVQGYIGEESPIYDIIDLVFLIINIPLSFGLIVTYIRLKRGENVKAFDYLKEGFSRFKKSWGISLRILLKLLLPMFCIFLTIISILIIFILGLAETLNYGITLSFDISALFKFLPVLFILFVFALIYMIAKSLLYSLAYYISYDNPELSSKECVLKSAELMKGNRGKYLLLLLSFIGWAILATLTLCIGFLWLMPYIQVSTVCFYEHLINSKVENIEEAIKTK